jgi:DNA-directed RNA polymerase subunit RPC12/RpoP
MAGKKPAKIASNAKSKNETIGKHVRYIGMGNKWYVCPTCSRKFLRGFFWEDGDKNGCTQRCLSKLIEA